MLPTGNPGLLPDITTPAWPGAPALCGCKNDLERFLPLSLIRSHTKTDDVPSVTDEQLKLYRQAAFEAAELYTGRLFSEVRVVTEDVATKPGRRHRHKPSYKHRLRYATADGKVYLFGSRSGMNNRVYDMEPGARVIEIPTFHDALDVSSCCNPCSSGAALNFGMKVTYRAGVDCERGAGIPAGITVGVLKFIAWSVENPGDVIMTVRNRQAGESSGIIGTNSTAWASGALEQWRQYVDTAI